MDVRKSTAASLHEIANMLDESDVDVDIFPVIDYFIKDVNDVRSLVLPHLAEIASCTSPMNRAGMVDKIDTLWLDGALSVDDRIALCQTITLMTYLLWSTLVPGRKAGHRSQTDIEPMSQIQLGSGDEEAAVEVPISPNISIHMASPDSSPRAETTTVPESSQMNSMIDVEMTNAGETPVPDPAMAEIQSRTLDGLIKLFGITIAAVQHAYAAVRKAIIPSVSIHF